jgi:hypothetical protein
MASERAVAVAGRLHHALPAGQRRAGVRWREAGKRAVDQAGVRRAQSLRIEAEPCHHAGPEILDEDIGFGDQRLRRRHAVRMLQVERDPLLVAIIDRVGWVRLAGPGAIDMDYLRPGVRQQHRGERTGDIMAEIDHANSAERARQTKSPVSPKGRCPRVAPRGWNRCQAATSAFWPIRTTAPGMAPVGLPSSNVTAPFMIV